MCCVALPCLLDLACFFLPPFSRLSLTCVYTALCRICPVFQVSNVTGENLDLLRCFLNLLSARMNTNEDKPAEFQIDETYSVPVSLWSGELAWCTVHVKYINSAHYTLVLVQECITSCGSTLSLAKSLPSLSLTPPPPPPPPLSHREWGRWCQVLACRVWSI